MTTKAKKQARTTSRKKNLTLNKETVRDLSAGEKAERVRGGKAAPGGPYTYNGCFGTLV